MNHKKEGNQKCKSDYLQKGRKQRINNFKNKLLTNNAIAGTFKGIGKIERQTVKHNKATIEKVKFLEAHRKERN